MRYSKFLFQGWCFISHKRAVISTEPKRSIQSPLAIEWHQQAMQLLQSSLSLDLIGMSACHE